MFFCSRGQWRSRLQRSSTWREHEALAHLPGSRPAGGVGRWLRRCGARRYAHAKPRFRTS